MKKMEAAAKHVGARGDAAHLSGGSFLAGRNGAEQAFGAADKGIATFVETERKFSGA
jgi:hypothetical protein